MASARTRPDGVRPSSSTERTAPTPGQPDKQPMPIPLRTALIGGETGHETCAERLIVLDQPRQSVTFENVTEPPLLSINRNFSAPIIVEADRSPGELERLAQLRDQGILTDEEFEAKKKQIIGI